MRKSRRDNIVKIVLLLWMVSQGITLAQAQVPDIYLIKKDVRTGASTGGWVPERQQTGNFVNLPAHGRVQAADIKGPGVIRFIHSIRIEPKELFARGLVLEIWFDDASEPAVICPLADFFGDGCNGSSMYFTSNLIECAPWSYNAYFPMPFKKRARVFVRNDIDMGICSYLYVEWETLPKWDDSFGYFHATYRRKCFQVTKDSDELFFEIKGTGHLVGRQFSIVTDEPLFSYFGEVMEGDNEVDIDGINRVVDYLGSEDSFTFSWGFQEPFAGQRAGMTLVQVGEGILNRVSAYRFHDHMPIRFAKSLRWHINWKNDMAAFWTKDNDEMLARDGGWVDYATVFYWYQDTPGGYMHEPLPSVAERQKTILKSSFKPKTLERVLQDAEVDQVLENDFSTRKDMQRVRILEAQPGTHPFWIPYSAPMDRGPSGNPNPGKQGMLAVYPRDQQRPCYVIRKVALPPQTQSLLRVVVSGDPFEEPGTGDFLLQTGIHDGKSTNWFKEETIDAGTSPSEDNWRTLKYDLHAYLGKNVGIIIKVSGGGPKHHWQNEEAFFDEISVVTK